MYNQTETILSQYEIEIREVTKGRGSFICDTDKGKLLLVPFRGSQEKGMLLRQFLEGLEQNDFPVEQIELTKNMEAVSQDECTGERFLLKTYVEGVEISTSKWDEMKQAVSLLAKYHTAAEQIVLEPMAMQNSEGLLESWWRHYRELLKARNYMRNRRKKSEFEQIYMANFEHNRKSAEEALELLEKVSEHTLRYVFCHGDCNQHNILRCGEEYRLVHFENFSYHWAMTDLSNFIRKMLEKNEWDEQLGRALIEVYDAVRPMLKDEYRQLYCLLLFPEKFWKVTNHYMNSRKIWISARDVDKLKTVMDQEEKRLNFMENVFSFLK